MKNLQKILAEIIPDGHLVGGCVRDAVLGINSGDIDIALPPEGLKERAYALAKKLGAAAFEMDGEYGVWRLTTRKEKLQIDLTAYQGKNFKEDILRRDFTVNSLAFPLREKFKVKLVKDKKENKTLVKITLDKKKIVDYACGLKDIKSKTLRINNTKVFKEDPLRMLRAYRTAAELGYKLSENTLKQIKVDKALISAPAGERVREEIKRIFALPAAAGYFKEMDKTGFLTNLFPWLEDQRECAEEYYGKDGVLKHTLAVMERMDYLLKNLKKVFPKHYKKLQPFADNWFILKTAALFHDIAKPATAKMIDGRLRFFFHEEKGAEMAKAELEKLRYSTAEIRLICAMIASHLRPTALASNEVISDKALYKFFQGLGEAAIPMLLMCWADYASYVNNRQLATILPRIYKPVISIERGKENGSTGKTLRHMQILGFMFTKYFNPKTKINPPKIINGAEVMAALDLPSGPRVGELLQAVAVAQVEGKVKTKEDAVKFLKTLKK